MKITDVQNKCPSFIQDIDGDEISSSLTSCEKETLITHSLELIKANTKQFLKPGISTVLNNPSKFLGISVGKFMNIIIHKVNSRKCLPIQQLKSKGDEYKSISTKDEEKTTEANIDSLEELKKKSMNMKKKIV